MDDLFSQKFQNKALFKKHQDSRPQEAPRVASRDRHVQRLGYRSEPKKGGFGKGAWGRLGEEEDPEGQNYSPDEDDF